MKIATLLLLAAATLVVNTGCGSSTAMQTPTSNTAANIDGRKFLLSQEPDDAIGVIDAREEAEDGAPVALVGRVGGSANPWIEGRAAFTMIDASMTVVSVGEEPGDGEICTGDCCAGERAGCTTLVKIVDDQGQLVPVDSRKLLGLKETDMIVVQGTAQKDESGNFVMLAKGVYIRD